MAKQLLHIKEIKFFGLLFQKTFLPILVIVIISLLYAIVMPLVDHKSFFLPYAILFLAVIKTLYISKTTLNKLSELMERCESVNRLLSVFALLIFISIVSFATDYTCLFQHDEKNFSGIENSTGFYLFDLYHFIYFSLITFSTVGYGDIYPISDVARFLVIMEIALSFFIVVFALANISKIHINE